MNGGFVYTSHVAGREQGLTLLEHLTRRFVKRTPEEWDAAIAAGLVCVNGTVATTARRVTAGDRVTYHRPPWAEPDAPLDLPVVFEDPHVLVVHKPAGLQVLPAGPFLAHTVFHLVRASAPDRAEAAPIHRLGRGTSGLLLLGKTFVARAALSRQFRARTPTKTYLALVAGARLPDSCVAEQPIGDVQHGPIRIHVARAGGKPARTRVRVLRRGAHTTLVAAQPITGRPDQIRIHLAALGAPIVGDPLFGPGGVAISDVTPGTGGYHLHAAGLKFDHPVSGVRVRLRAPAPWRHSG
ncbi:MAG: RluA family pseudouridine synthase [Planctomycetes bacterium]|nr:RluA family pseudouridine synthase [Planctomycetota bacterium]